MSNNSDGRDWYLSRINSVKPADRHSNHELVRRYRMEGDRSALDEILTTNLGLVYTWASKYQKGTYSSLHDLMQCGLMGLITAADRFDLDAGTAFSTYAVPLIIQNMRNYHSDNYLVRIPRDASQLSQIIHKALEATGCSPDDINWPTIKAEIDKHGTTQSKRIGLHTLKQYRFMPHVYSYDAFSQQDAKGEDPLKATGEERVTARQFDREDENHEDTVAATQLHEILEQQISNLDEREQLIVRKYFQMEHGDVDETHTLESLAPIIGVTRERVRQIMNAALKKIRVRMSAAGLSMADFA